MGEEELRRAIAERGLDPETLVIPSRLNQEMKDWLADRVRSYGSNFEILRDLIEELQSPRDLDLVYEPGYTGTAEEVFSSGQFNCLSYTNLFVGMARELGIEAYYVAVNGVERYRRDGDLVVRSGHVTAGYDAGPSHRVLEFSIGPDADYRRTEPLSDLRAMALYYSNRGAELLREKDYSRAVQRLETAVRLDPALAETWINLGVARRRLLDLDGAEVAYQRGIDEDPEAFSGYLNLTTLYRIRGEREAAKKLLRLLGRRKSSNPFLYLALGDDSLEEGRLDDAEHFYRRALSLADEPAEARAALGAWALAAGDRELASRWLERAQRRDPANPRVIKLARDLAAHRGSRG